MFMGDLGRPQLTCGQTPWRWSTIARYVPPKCWESLTSWWKLIIIALHVAHYAASLSAVHPAGRPLCKGFNLDFTPGSTSAGLILTTLVDIYNSALLNIPWVPRSFFGPATKEALDSKVQVSKSWRHMDSTELPKGHGGDFLELLLRCFAILLHYLYKSLKKSKKSVLKQYFYVGDVS